MIKKNIKIFITILCLFVSTSVVFILPNRKIIGASSKADPDRTVIASGEFIGIKINMGGLLIVGLDDIVAEDGKFLTSPAKKSGLRVGDLIVGISGNKLETVDELVDAVQKLKGEATDLEYKRDDVVRQTRFAGVYDTGSGDYKIGAWVKDTAMGLGTITYYEPKTGKYVGVGHTILDDDTKHIVPFESGEIYEGVVTGIRKGMQGEPGEIRGTFASPISLGSIFKNSETGITGKLKKPDNTNQIKVATDEEISVGEAYMICEPFGIKEKFKIEITKIAKMGEKDKGLTVRVTDKRLLDRTGGIIQGMSGSPIIQNNKLVGSITHVLVSDPTRGYASKISELF
ncbi:SpoIVB peptidase S55 domain-containing protein [Treponema sp. R6D11]